MSTRATFRASWGWEGLSLIDDEAIREFLMTTYPRLVAGVALIAGNGAAAEDAVQEALARAWEHAARGEPIDSLPAWVTRVAVNLSKSRLRRIRAESRARERLGIDAVVREPADHRVDVERALAALPRRQRQVTVLHYYLELSVKEIATTLQVNEGTVKTSLHRARQALARALGNHDPDEEVSDDARHR